MADRPLYTHSYTSSVNLHTSKMKYFVAILALAAVATADVKSYDAEAVILKQEADVFPDKFQYVVETSNGILSQQSGVLENVGREDEAISVQGSDTYTAPDGQIIKTVYVADKDGYKPQGAHLPTPPAPLEIPEYILRALEYIRTHPPKEQLVKKL